MADNVDITPGTGKTVAADDIGGVLYPRGKIGFGTDGSYTEVSASDPLPVTGPLTDTQLRASAVPVSLASVPSHAVTGPLTDTELRASAVPVSGSVTVQDGGGSVTVDGTFWQATQPVSAASLPLPTGASTAANQATGNTSLASIDAKLPALSGGAVPVSATPAASELHLGEVGGRKVSVTATFTRPADTTAYAAGDAVSNSTSATTALTFASFARVNAGSGYIVGCRLVTDKKSITPRIRVHLFSDSTATFSADNAAFRRLYADESKRIGTFDLPAMTTPADTTNSTESMSQDLNLRIPFVAGAGTRSIYAVLEALDAFTPASGEGFSLTLIGDLD